jgi:tetratricopeptide (TPR) repeat protein
LQRGGITRLLDSLKFVLKQCTVKRIALVVFVLPALFYLYDEATHSVLVIDPIKLPDGFGKDGFSSDVMSNRIGDAIRYMEESAQTKLKKEKLRSLQDEALTPDVEVPGVKDAVKQVVDITRGVFNIYPKHITSDLVVSQASAPLHKNLDTAICNDAKLADKQRAAIITVYASQKRDRSPAVTVAVPADDLDGLAQCAAEIVLREVNPYVLAVYKSQQDHSDSSLQILEGIIQDPAQDSSALIAALIFKGNVLSQQKDYENAESNYAQAIEIDGERRRWYNNPKFAPSFLALPPPHAADVYNSWGNMFEDKGDYPKAIEYYQKAVKFDPANAMAYTNLGNVAEAKHEYAKAIEEFEQAIRVDPRFAAAYVSWGNVIDERNVNSDPEQYKAAIERYQAAIKSDPKVPESYKNWGDVLTKQAKFDDAIAKYRKATELNPKYPGAYLGWGKALYKQHEYPQASEKYQKAIELDPKYADAYLNWGDVLYDQQQYPEAIRKYQKAIEIHPNSADAYLNWGIVLTTQQKYPEAITRFQKAIELDPQSADAYLRWGIVLTTQQKYPWAITKYQKAIELNPNSADAYLDWGTVLFVQQRYADAIEKYQAAAKLDPTSELAYKDWGLALTAWEQYDQTRSARYQKALRGNANDAAAHKGLDEVRDSQDKLRASRNLLATARPRSPQ